ncbi:hypothetical protein ONS95_001867 [Cadophora gregata]|uniref:uncharacterized protein n=1 Tax=Cadophora gregata TaxID=51156 RepID=UPI0026DC78CC|nr:uncharacterized protein ONS95_001867 [Cadophora gregata]KAK0111513.1 hypothetical protein ONS95_001867 [Cadophora gregata]KAK0112011.1 hypothetical protein ONS96_001273 [Cadophora gregata f. sp. sojae]
MDAALVTGCSEGGLGEGIVRAFLAEGLHVFATARSISSMAYLQHIPNITLLALDVTSSESIASVLSSVKSHLHLSPNTNNGTHPKQDQSSPRRLKYLINNAGIGLIRPLLNGTGISDAERLIYETNVWGPLALIRALTPLMIAGNTVSGGGSGECMVVNITSGAALVPLAWHGVYSSSKAAMASLSEAMGLEMEPLGVRIGTVILGIVKTNFHANMKDQRVESSEGGGEGGGEDEGGERGDERYELAEGSYYEGIRHILRDQASGKIQQGNICTAKEAGRQIVRDAVKGKKGKTYIGSSAGMMSILGIIPQWIVDAVCKKTGQLEEFVKA